MRDQNIIEIDTERPEEEKRRNQDQGRDVLAFANRRGTRHTGESLVLSRFVDGNIQCFCSVCIVGIDPQNFAQFYNPV